MDYSLARLIDWVDFVDARGIIGTSRAGGWRVAINRILADLSPAETEDVRKIDLDSVMKRFINRNPHDLMPSSLAEYHRRVRIAIQEFTAWQDKLYGTDGRAAGAAQGSSSGSRRRSDQPERNEASLFHDSAIVPVPATSTRVAENRGLALDFPLRPEFTAQVIVPRDLTSAEARRLGAFLSTLAVDFKPWRDPAGTLTE